ncbi:SPFH/Band 7/PHB domain protein [Patescibacteria group bacterium]|nr:SPFH/Band 7/PHB domain protein [Patescibacteria group bacterium]
MFKKHWKICSPGLCWRFRWFSEIDAKVFMGDQSVQLPLGRPDTGGGLVNFKDESASMDITLYFRIVNSYRAAYKTDDVVKMITDWGDDVIRSFLALFSIEEVNVLKNNSDIGWIAAGNKPIEGANAPDLKQSQFYVTLMSWGVEPLYFIIGDTDMPEAIVEQVKRKQKAKIDIEVSFLEVEVKKNEAEKVLVAARADKKAEVLRATGVAEGMDKISKAMAFRIKELVDKNGMTEAAAREHVILLAKMDALKGSNQVIWSEGNSAASQGAAFGAGFNSNRQETPNQEAPVNQ